MREYSLFIKAFRFSLNASHAEAKAIAFHRTYGPMVKLIVCYPAIVPSNLLRPGYRLAVVSQIYMAWGLKLLDSPPMWILTSRLQKSTLDSDTT